MGRTQAVVASSGSGIGFTGFLFFIFLVLKLCGVIGWSWWWVTSPLWLPFAILIGMLAPALVVVLIAAIIVSVYKMLT